MLLEGHLDAGDTKKAQKSPEKLSGTNWKVGKNHDLLKQLITLLTGFYRSAAVARS